VLSTPITSLPSPRILFINGRVLHCAYSYCGPPLGKSESFQILELSSNVSLCISQIFQRVEEQNEARARQAEAEDRVSANLSRIESSDNLRKSRRRGSISITRFGQVAR